MSAVEKFPEAEDFPERPPYQQLFLDGFSLSVSALNNLKRFGLPVVDELLDDAAQTIARPPEQIISIAVSEDQVVIPLLRRRQPIRRTRPAFNTNEVREHDEPGPQELDPLLPPETEDHLHRLDTPELDAALSPENETLESANSTRGKSEADQEILNLPAVKILLASGVALLAEAETISEDLGIDPKEAVKLFVDSGLEIADLEEEDSTGPYEDNRRKLLPEAVIDILDEGSRSTNDSLQLFMNDAGRYPLLTAADEVYLAKRIERGDDDAKKRMINSNLRLVVSIAKRYQGHDVPLLDLIQEGSIGLNRAVEKFDWRKGYKFSTYGTWWIRQSCQRAVANLGNNIRIPVHVQERRIKLNRARAEFLATSGREATAAELAGLTKLKEEHVVEALDVVSTISLNKSLGDDSDNELGDLIADQQAEDPAEESERAFIQARVNEALDQLPEREREILKMRFGFDGESASLETIGRMFGLTRERVRQLEMQSLRAVQQTLSQSVELEANYLLKTSHMRWL
jgi:RNA polymerase primary sigma factor